MKKKKRGHSLINSWLMKLFIGVTVIWVGVAITNSISDVVTGDFENKWLSYSFIVSILSGGYLKGRDVYTRRKIKSINGELNKKPSDCKKCGKRKTTNV